MTDMRNDISLESDAAVEALLGKASPRLMPPPADAEAVRAAVRTEWQVMTGHRRSRRRFVGFAAAASVLVAGFLTLEMTGTGNMEAVEVAAIDKRIGTVFVLGKNAERLDAAGLAAVDAGQTLVTGEASGVGLAWGTGGSLRLDAATRVEFLAADRIYLRAGRIYFDSGSAAASVASVSGSDARLTIATDFGEVTHVGTQYMVHADGERMTVSVREGEVLIDSARGSETAGRNRQMAISGSGAPSIVNIRSWGAAWEWVEAISPNADIDGRPLSEFLEWVSRETGLELRYESADVLSHARRERLVGIIETEPRQALGAWLPATDLGWRIEDGVIYVGKAR